MISRKLVKFLDETVLIISFLMEQVTFPTE